MLCRFSEVWIKTCESTYEFTTRALHLVLVGIFIVCKDSGILFACLFSLVKGTLKKTKL